MSTFFQDIRYTVRALTRSPDFTTIAVLTLALGIGANSAIFSVVNTVLLRPLEYTQADRLVFIHSQFPTLGFDKFWVSPPEYRELQQHTRSYEAIGGWRIGSVSISAIENPVRVTSAIATAEFFAALGVPAELGRPYSIDEDINGESVVVLSHRIWSGAFGGDPTIVGRTIEVDGAGAPSWASCRPGSTSRTREWTSGYRRRFRRYRRTAARTF